MFPVCYGYGLHELWRGGGWRRGLGAVLVAWQVAGFMSAFPDPLAYFNLLAGDHPERISLDSDYDWGQESLILDEALRARGIDAIYFCGRAPVSTATLLHARVMRCPQHRVAGGAAVGRATRLRRSSRLAWIDGAAAVGPIGDVSDLYRSTAP